MIMAELVVAAKPSASRWGILLCKGNIPQGCHSGTSNRLAAARVAGRVVANSLAQCKQGEVAVLLPQAGKHSMGNRDTGNAGDRGRQHKIPYQHDHDQPTPLRLIATSTWHLQNKFA